MQGLLQSLSKWSHLLRLRSLKARLALTGAALIAAAVALTVGLTLSTLGHHTEEMALDLSLAQTRKLAKLVGRRLVDMQLALRAASQRFAGLEALDVSAADAFLLSRPVLVAQFDSVFVATPQGQVLAAHDGAQVTHPALSLGDRPYFRQTIEQQRPVISAPLIGRSSREPIVTLTFPVIGADGRLAAVIGGTLKLGSHRLLSDIVDGDEADPAQTVVIDAHGRVVAHPEREWLMREASSMPLLAAAVAHWADQGRPIEPLGQAQQLGTRLVTSAGVPDADWVVFRSADQAAVLGSVAQARSRAVQLGAALAATGGLVLLLATTWLLWPLRRLEHVARSLAGGQTPNTAAWPKASGEIGQLAAVLRQALEARDAADADGRRVLTLLHAVMAHAPLGFAITRDRRFEMVGTAFERLLGYPAGMLDGQPPRIIYASEAFYEELGPRVGSAFASRQAFDEEVDLVRRDGSRFWGRLKGQPVDWDNAVAGTIWTLDDVTEQRQQRQSLAWASSHDTLTELVNRAEFDRRLAGLLAERRQSGGAALFIDLDRFKAVNDSAGHAAGDAVLQAVARVIEGSVRQADTVARLGGDEFAVLLPGCPPDNALRIAEKMRAAVEALALPWAEHTLRVGASLGLVHLDASLADAAAVMTAADAACYAAKRGGRNSVRVHGRAELRLVGDGV